ncbi:MAG: ABC transporter permease, partial [Advenella sp.]
MTTQSQKSAPFLFFITFAVCLFMFIPVIISVMAGLVNNYRTGLKSGLTLRWIEEVWSVYGSTVSASVILALVCVTCTLLLGVPCAYALARSRSRFARAFEEILTLPVAVPG